jgi:hypothetical protein
MGFVPNSCPISVADRGQILADPARAAAGKDERPSRSRSCPSDFACGVVRQTVDTVSAVRFMFSCRSRLWATRFRPGGGPTPAMPIALSATRDRRRKCRHRAELDLETLVWTRGRNMPLAGLNARMMCPRCGSRNVHVMFEPPNHANREPKAEGTGFRFGTGETPRRLSSREWGSGFPDARGPSRQDGSRGAPGQNPSEKICAPPFPTRFLEF